MEREYQKKKLMIVSQEFFSHFNRLFWVDSFEFYCYKKFVDLVFETHHAAFLDCTLSRFLAFCEVHNTHNYLTIYLDKSIISIILDKLALHVKVDPTAS